MAVGYKYKEQYEYASPSLKYLVTQQAGNLYRVVEQNVHFPIELYRIEFCWLDNPPNELPWSRRKRGSLIPLSPDWLDCNSWQPVWVGKNAGSRHYLFCVIWSCRKCPIYYINYFAYLCKYYSAVLDLCVFVTLLVVSSDRGPPLLLIPNVNASQALKWYYHW